MSRNEIHKRLAIVQWRTLRQCDKLATNRRDGTLKDEITALFAEHEMLVRWLVKR